MIAPRCTSCGRTVLELRGQYAHFDSYLVSGGEPPPDTAGTWHLPCLERAGVGPRWHAALVRNLVDVRRYEVLGRAGDSVALRTPTGDPIAVGPLGEVLPLRSSGPARPVEDGLVVAAHEAEYNLELEDAVAIDELQSALRAHGSISLPAVAEILAIADCLVRPDLQTDAAWVLEDPEATDEWTRRFVSAAVSYRVFIPRALVPFVGPKPL